MVAIREAGKINENTSLIDIGMMEVVFKEINPAPIYPEILSVKLKILAGVMTAVTKILRKQPVPLYKHLMKGIVEWLAEGYKTYKAQSG